MFEHKNNFAASATMPDFATRAQSDQIYVNTPPIYIRVLKDTHKPHRFPYYGIDIDLPPSLPRVKTIEELSWGLFAMYDDKRELVGLVDIAKEFEIQGMLKKSEPIQATFIDINKLNDSLQKTAFSKIFSDRGITIEENEIGLAVKFFNPDQYRPFAAQLIENLESSSDPTLHYKTIPFGTCYRNWKYFENKKQNRQLYIEYQIKLNKITRNNPGIFLGIFGEKFSSDETDELINKLFELKNAQGCDTSTQYFNFGEAFRNLEEVDWLITHYHGGPLEKYHNLYNKFKEEGFRVLSRSFQFMVRELHASRQNEQEFNKRYKYFTNLFGTLKQIFDPDFETHKIALENLNIYPDIFDQLVLTKINEGRDSIRDLWCLILQTGSQTAQNKAQMGPENDPFYENFFRHFLQGIYEGTILPEKTTGDTEIEQLRFKSAIEIAVKANNLDYNDLSVFEMGVGTGRIINWLLDKFPKMKAYGIDIVEKQKLLEFGLSEKVRFIKNNIMDLTPKVLKDTFGIEKVDIIIAPWSFFGDLSDSELKKVLSAIKKIAKVVISDNPLATVQNSAYMNQMSPSAQPYKVAIHFNQGNPSQQLTKFIYGRPPESLIQMHTDQGIRIINIPTDLPGREQFYDDLRMPLKRTSDANVAQWITAIGKPRITLIGDCT
jgi:hypothetical protein